jgi:hypothetical protein
MQVELTQYIRPNGRKEKTLCEVSDDVAELAENMELSCEVLDNGLIALYAYYNGTHEEDEQCMIASNGPGESSPPKVLEKLIRKTYKLFNKES